MAQLDWVQIQAEKHRRLLNLQGIIQQHLELQELYSGSIINTTLLMIQREHGAEARTETCRMFRLQEELPAAA